MTTRLTRGLPPAPAPTPVSSGDASPTLPELATPVVGDLGLPLPSSSEVSFGDLVRMRNGRVQRTESVRPLSELISYRRFERLVQESVARVPDLEPLWAWQSQQKGQPGSDRLYLMGGVLRGLLVWLQDNLQKHGEEALAKLPVPSTLELLRQPADRDILALGEIESKAEKVVEELGEGWEMLRSLDHRNNVKLGGATLEKVGVGPRGIEDPLGGLRHFWEGKLVFHFDGTQRSSLKHGYSVLAEALRFLRFVHELPGLCPTAESLEKLKQVGAAELGGLGRTSEAKYLIEKPLAKLLHAVGDDPLRVLKLLQDADLLEVISDGSYQLPREASLGDMVSGLIDARFSATELLQARRVLRLTNAEQVAFTTAAIDRRPTPEQVLPLIALSPGADSGVFAQQLGDALAERSFTGSRWTKKKKAALEHAIQTLRSPTYFFRDFFTVNQTAYGSSVEVSLGMALPKEDSYASHHERERAEIGRRVIERLPRLPEAEKTELAKLLLRVADDDPALEAPHGSDEIALRLLAILEPKDEAVHLALLDPLLADASSGGAKRTETLVQLELGRAAVAKIEAAVVRSLPKVEMSLAQLAFHFGAGARLRRESIAGVEEQLAKKKPDHAVVGELMRQLQHCPDVPDAVIERTFSLVEKHVLSGRTNASWDPLVAGFSVFLRGRTEELGLRMNQLVAKAWAKQVDTGDFLDAWVGLLRCSSSDRVKSEGRRLVIERFAAEGPDPKLAHAWRYYGPKDFPLPSQPD